MERDGRAPNNRALARQNSRLLQQAAALKAESELAAHRLNVRSAAFKAREAEAEREISRLQAALRGAALREAELGAQLQASCPPRPACAAMQPRLGAEDPKRECLAVQEALRLLHCQAEGRVGEAAGAAPHWVALQQRRTSSESDLSGGWAASPLGRGPEDSFLVCAGSLGSAASQSQQQRGSLGGSPMVLGSAGPPPAPAQDSFLVCADSAALDAQLQRSACTAQPEDEDSADSSVTGGKEQHPPQAGPAASPQLLQPQGRKEAEPPARATLISLPKTVRLFANRGLIALPQQPKRGGTAPSASKQPLRPASGSCGSGAAAMGSGAGEHSCGAVESQGSNQPGEVEPAEGQQPRQDELGLGSAADRWSGTTTPPPDQQLPSRDEAAAVEAAGGAFTHSPSNARCAREVARRA